MLVGLAMRGGEGRGGGGAGVKYNRQGMYQHMQIQNCLVASFRSQCQGLELRVLKTLTSNLGCKAGSEDLACQQREHYALRRKVIECTSKLHRARNAEEGAVEQLNAASFSHSKKKEKRKKQQVREAYPS